MTGSKRKVHRMIAAGAGLALLGTGVAALAQGGDMAAAVQARQAHYKAIGHGMKGVVDQLKSPSPSIAAIQQDAREIDLHAPQLVQAFPKGSGPESGVKTAAKAEIWTRPDLFKHDLQDFITEAHKFDQVAATGDLARIKAEVPALGGTCKTCHQDFRARED